MFVKQFFLILTICLYSVSPVFAGNTDQAQVRGHWQDTKMRDLKAHPQTQLARWCLNSSHLKSMCPIKWDLQLMKKPRRMELQSGVEGKGLISRYKHKYEISVGRNPIPNRRLLMDLPSHKIHKKQSQRSCMRWDKNSGRNSGQDCGRNSNKRNDLAESQGTGNYSYQSRTHKWQKSRDVDIKASDEFGGLGLKVTMEDNAIRVVAILNDKPAHQAGLLPGDQIIRLEDTFVKDLSLREVVSKMRGEPGTQIRLLITREGQPEPFKIAVERAIIHIDNGSQSFDSD